MFQRQLLYKWWRYGVGLGSAILAAGILSTHRASGTADFLREHVIPGPARNIVAEAPGRLWFTMPERNAIGSLVVGETITVTEFVAPTAASEPMTCSTLMG